MLSLPTTLTGWYADSGITNHITSDLGKLTTRDKYNGPEHVHAANGTGMEISHIDSTTFSNPTHDLHLRNVLCVPCECHFYFVA